MNTSTRNLDYVKEHLKNIQKYSILQDLFLDDQLSRKERFHIAQFRLKYQLVLITEFKDKELVQECINLGKKIVNLQS